MPDRLSFWLLLATVFVAAVTMAIVGFQRWAVVGLVHVPAVLLAMLALRAVVQMARQKSPALRVGGSRILPGWWALVVPAVLLAAWISVRETGLLSARLTTTSSSDRANTRWHSNSTRVGEGLTGGTQPMPAAFEHAPQFEVVGGDSALHERFAAELQPVAQLLPGHRIVGRIELQATPPFAALPLWKSASTASHATCELYLCELDSGACRATLKGDVDVESDCTMWGFASQRDFHEYLGARFGEVTRKRIVEQLDELAEKLR
jgi:hypothetical protein